MATSGHYKELTDGWEVIERADSLTGTRVFIDTDATATDALPEINDLFDATDSELAGLKCIEVRRSKHGKHPSNQIYTVLYSTAPGASDSSGSGETDTDPNFLPVTGSISAEAISIDGAKSGSIWKWENDATKVDQQMFKKIITGSFKITRRLGNLPMNTWCEYNGKINSSTMKIAGTTFPASCVMFNGVEFDEYRNNYGNRRWKANFNFSVKLIPDGASPVAYYGWNYLYDEKTNEIRRPYIVTSNVMKYMYATADLNKLLQTNLALI